MNKPTLEPASQLQALGLAAGFVGAGLLWIGGQVPFLSVLVLIAVVLLAAFMLAMGSASRR